MMSLTSLSLSILYFSTVNSVLLPTGSGCFCQGVDDNNRDLVFVDLGMIKDCSTLGMCACTPAGIGACKRACDKMVETWALLNCPLNLREREVRARFIAGSCQAGLGNTHNCRVRECRIPCPNPAIMDNLFL